MLSEGCWDQRERLLDRYTDVLVHEQVHGLGFFVLM